MKKYHVFHLVNVSPWPVLSAVALFNLVVSFVGYIHNYDGFFEDFFFHLANVAGVAGFWWRDVVREATFGGHHTRAVQKGLKMGFTLFLVSEAMLFFSLFWTFFYLAVHPSGSYLGTHWTKHVLYDTIQANHVPLVNTYVLLWSGATLTFSHYCLLRGRLAGAVDGLVFTLCLGLLFLFLQGVEYKNAKFDISDGVFGSTFYLLTGFHGLHVLLGWVFLAVGLVRLGAGHFTPDRHLGYEMAIWYWHFVDVIWVFLFFAVYVWGTHPTTAGVAGAAAVH
jgi:heme/copper-type cytochrome/quinol oxidase subunit 3